jgi:geranylgeranylglycerol-phosphate geranylgeranyltransferase
MMAYQPAMSKTRVLGLLRLFRFELPLTAGVCVIIGGLLALGELPTLSAMVSGFSCVFLISAASLILNDYFDLESDRINAPHRPLPSGMVSERDVILLFSAVTLAGLIVAYLISPAALLVALLVWAVGFLYNWRGKQAGLPGNLMVSFSVGMTFIFGGLVVGQPWAISVWFFALLAALINLGEEIAADAMDAEGDRQAGSRSLAVTLGPEKALKISARVFLLAVVASILPFLLGLLAWIYLPPILFMDGVILYSTSKLLDVRISSRRKYIRWIYLSALAAFLIFLLIRLIW